MDAFARGELAGFVFAFASFRTATGFRFRIEFAELFHTVVMIAERLRNALRFSQRNLPEAPIP